MRGLRFLVLASALQIVLSAGLDYRFVSTRLTYSEAKHYCTKTFGAGSTLAVVDSDDVRDIVAEKSNNVNVWIGLQKSSGKWNTPCGKANEYNGWDTAFGQPNDKGEKCVRQTGKNPNNYPLKKWHDISCGTKRPFVCQIKTQCSENRCHNGGECIEMPCDFKCQCKEGWEGKHCEKRVCKCEAPGEKPNCKDRQKAFLIESDKECGCKKWSCLYISCGHIKFDPKKPIECNNCSFIPVQKDDCGCPTWECARRPCDKKENQKITKCPSECDVVDVEPRCGCLKYGCVHRPPPEDGCKKGCKKCQHCVKRHWISRECSEQTGFKESFCEKAPCPAMKTCGPCQVANETADDCGCSVVRCVDRKVEDKCGGSCNQCEACTLVKDEECPKAGIKTCQRKGCATPKPLTCEKCSKVETETDDCGCAHNSCRKQRCPSAPTVPVCKEKCHEPKLTTNECGCKEYICEKVTPSEIKPTQPPECSQECEKCHTCQWVKNPECGTWEAACKRACPKVVIPSDMLCYEKVTLDDCGCDVAPKKKPCASLPVGKCKNGTVPCRRSDACECEHQVCCPCKAFDPNSCNNCQRPHFNSPTGSCRSGTCIPKKCPPLKKTKCGSCQEKKVERDACGCAVEQCVEKTCKELKSCPPDQLSTKVFDECECLINKCSLKCPKEKSCAVERCRTECEECPKPVLPGGYKEGIVSGRAFKVHSEKKTWQEARKTCKGEGGDLVIVDLPSVNDWLAKQDMKMGCLWLGATDMKNEGTFVWTNGAPTTKKYWGQGQPDNNGGVQDCAVVNWGKPGQWDDQSCNVKNAFVCQISF